MKTPNYIDAKKRNFEKVNIIRDFKINDELKNIGSNKKYLIKTYGCQMNERDSENISAILENMGYKKAIDYNDADLIILNTCAIRENAHNKVFGMLGRLKHMKEERPLMIGLCGCMAQEEVVVNEIMKKYKYVDLVFGTHNIHELPEILNNAIKNNSRQIEVWSKEGDIVEDIPIKRESKYKAWVNIMYGCDKFCTYCIVPYTRGKQRSRLKEDIIKEVEDLVKDGYKEVTLLGQNVNAYGKDFKDAKYNMANLLEDVSKTKIERIKFVTSHPWDFTDDMIKVIKENENILPYIHLPVQSGSNRILKLMGRKYTKESYLDLVKKLKENIPNICLTTDIIVGFPGETDEEFAKTYEFLKEIDFYRLHVFKYSPRRGTVAEKMPNQIDGNKKEERSNKLIELSNSTENKHNKNYIGKTVKVLFEEFENGFFKGHTTNYMMVKVAGEEEQSDKFVNKILDVKIKENNDETRELIGILS